VAASSCAAAGFAIEKWGRWNAVDVTEIARSARALAGLNECGSKWQKATMMGRRGPPPKPTPLRKLQGNASKRKLNEREPQVPPVTDAGQVRRPRWIKRRTAAATIWDELAERLVGMKVLTRADETALALLCDAIAELRECLERVRAEGRTYESVRIEEKQVCGECDGMDGHDDQCSGEGEQQPVRVLRKMIRSHPLLPTIGTLRTHIRGMLQEFGITPSARARVATGDEDTDDDFASKYLRRAGA
jgi:P27 family predicted phage terminase small subunit